MSINSSFPLASLVFGLCVFSLTGCGQAPPQYTPDASKSQEALTSALNAWVEGIPPGEIPNSKPKVIISDQSRPTTQKLMSYEILGEVKGSAGRTYLVSLALEDPNATLEAQYIVVGIDPIWIFRQEDYELLMHWDHHMPQKDQKPASETESKSPEKS